MPGDRHSHRGETAKGVAVRRLRNYQARADRAAPAGLIIHYQWLRQVLFDRRSECSGGNIRRAPRGPWDNKTYGLGRILRSDRRRSDQEENEREKDEFPFRTDHDLFLSLDLKTYHNMKATSVTTDGLFSY